MGTNYQLQQKSPKKVRDSSVHPQQHESDTATVSQILSRDIPANQLTPSNVLALQRTIGNQAVQRLLKSNRPSSAIQRDPIDPDVDIRSPFAETLFNQASVIQAAIEGRPLRRNEQALARPVFGNSLDYSRVRIIVRDTLAGTTVGNNIRLHEGFNIDNPEDAQLLIHELTHVWQYQHTGTSYISESLHTQIIGHIETGNRNAAYDYIPDDSKTFFDYTPEQQAFIVENYYAMQRDRGLIAAGEQTEFKSNHLGDDGFPRRITAAERQAEIDSEMPIHQTYIQQMQQALPRTEYDLLIQSTQDWMTMPGDQFLPPDRQTVPLNPLLQIRF